MEFKPLLPPADSADQEHLGTLKWFRELGHQAVAFDLRVP